MRDIVELHWPALLAGSACAGLSLSNWLHELPAGWVTPAWMLVATLALGALLGIAVLDGHERVVALAVVLAASGLWWGSLRLDARAHSVLSAEIGRYGNAELVVVGPARRTPWAIRATAEVRAYEGRRIHERVLLVLPVGRSPPRGAVLDTLVRVTEPRPAEGGFDERAWLARQGIHVVARARSWRQVGTRGGVAGIGDRLRDRIEAAVGRGASGVRRALVLGVVLGEDEGLPTQVRDDFRASGLAHLLRELTKRQNVSILSASPVGRPPDWQTEAMA